MNNFFMNYNNETGMILGFYLKEIHGDNIPSPNIEITEEKHNFYMENNGKYKLNPITLEDELIPILEPLPQPKTNTQIMQEQIDFLTLQILDIMGV